MVIDGHTVLSCLKEAKYEYAHCLIHWNLSREETLMLMIQLNIGHQTVNEASLAEIVSDLASKHTIRDLQNRLPIEKDEIEHYVELFKFIFEEYVKPKQDENQAKLF